MSAEMTLTVSESAVRESVAVARSHGEKFFEQIVWQVENEAWTVLGYESWDAMRAGEYMDMGVVAPRADRPELVARLRAKGLTQEVIAGTLGVDQKTVSRDLNRQMPNEDEPEMITNARGQLRPAAYASRPVQVDDLTVDERTGEVLDSNPSRGTQFPGSSESAPVEVVHTETVKTTEKFDPKPPLTGGAAEQHNADTNCAVTGKALLTFEAYTYPAHRERMLDTWWPMGSRNIQPMHAALFNSSDVRRIAAAMYALADEMEAHHDYI